MKPFAACASHSTMLRKTLALFVLISMLLSSTTLITASAATPETYPDARGRYRAKVKTGYTYYGLLAVPDDATTYIGGVKLYPGEIYNVTESYGWLNSNGTRQTRMFHVVDGDIDGWAWYSDMEYVGPLEWWINFNNVSSIPNQLKGAGFYTSGTITSKYPITQVEAYFINANTGAMTSTPSKKTITLNTTSVNIRNDVDPVLYFAQIPLGTWKLVLKATDRYGNMQTYTSNAFSVTDANSYINFNNVSTIPNIALGNGFYTSGTISSNYSITKVVGYFIDAYSGAQSPKPAVQSVSLSGTTINIASQVDQILYFAQLPIGTWKLVLVATNSQGKSQTYISNAFNVTDVTDDCNYWNCSTSVAGWYRVASSGLNVNSGHNWNSYIGEMPPNAVCWVSKGSTTGPYYHVIYNGSLEGISSKNLMTRLESFTLSFNDNGGFCGPGNVTVWDGISDYYAVVPPYRNNYAFEGYYTDIIGGTQVYNASGYCTNEGAYWSNNAYVHRAGAILYAHWRPTVILADGVYVSPDHLTLTIGENAQLTATVSPANVTNGTVNWFVDDPRVATVVNGKVTAVGAGSTTITVETTDGTELTAVCMVTVLPHYVSTISISAGVVEVKAGQTLQLSATVLPENATDKRLIWKSSDETIAVVDTYGKALGVAQGNAIITALAADGSGVSESISITVLPAVDAFTLDSYSLLMADAGIGARSVIGYMVEPAEMADSIVWSSSAPEVAVVDAGGQITAMSAGRAVITASIPYGPSESCVIQVKNDLSLITLPIDLNVIEEEAFCGIPADRVQIQDACTTIGSRAFADSSLKYLFIPSSVTSIASDAFEGSAQVCIICSMGSAAEAFAEAHGLRYVLDDAASFVNVRKINLPESASLEIEDSIRLEATVLPENASNPALLWSSSNETVARVSGEGVVTGLNPGTAVITAVAADGSGRSAKCTVNITLPDISVTVVGNVDIQTENDIRALLAADIHLSGTSNENVQQIGILLYNSEDLRIGTFMVDPQIVNGTLVCSCDTVEDMNLALTPTTEYRWRCAVVVKGVTFNSDTLTFTTPSVPPRIILNYMNLEANVGDAVTIAAEVLYSQDTDIIWSTSNSNVAMVLEGEVVAKAAGKATITARLISDPSVSTTCQVIVNAESADARLELSTDAITLVRGESTKLEATLSSPLALPIQWRSSDTQKAVVDGNGTVTAISAGCAEIFAKVDQLGLETSCLVTVFPRMVEEITMSRASLTLPVGHMDQLIAEALPLSADERAIVWSSSRPRIAEVEDGMVHALAVGETEIIASSVDGSGVSTACSLRVEPEPVICGCEAAYAGTYRIARTNGTGLAISSGHGASTANGNTELGIIPEGAEVYISRASGPAGQSGCWGHVTYEGISGYCAMYYIDPILEVDTSSNRVNLAKLRAVINRANEWADYVWIAPVDIPVYNNNFDDSTDPVAYREYFWYRAGTEMHGVPYTLASSKYRIDTYSILSDASKGTATNFTYDGWLMWGPKYGGDCTCLLNDVLWAGDPTLPHDGQVYMTKKAYLYSDPDWDDVAPGDALATSGHVMIVTAVDGDRLTIVESRGNGDTVGAIRCQNLTPREGGGWYVCGTCDYCNGANKCGAIRRTVNKSTLIDYGYSVKRYKMLYSD